MRVETTDLVTINQIAQKSGFSPATVRSWLQRYEDFPAAAWTGNVGDPSLFKWSDVAKWLTKTGRAD